MRTLELVIIWCYAKSKSINFKFTKLANMLLVFMFSLWFYIGLHNIDNAWNLRYVEMVLDEDYWWVDLNTFGHGFNANQIYVIGFIMTIIGFIGIAFSMYLLGREK